MTATEIKEALAQGKDATRSTWESGTMVTQIPETETYEKTLPDGSKEPYVFEEYDKFETDWSLVETKATTEDATEKEEKVEP
jgi:hypothetical protein